MSSADDKRRGGHRKGLLFIVSAPSGAGKTTLCRMAEESLENIRYSTSFTTRAPREGERNGEAYHFVDRERFQEMIERNDFLEWAVVHGNMYGTSMSELEAHLEEGYDMLLDIDVQGARQVRERVERGIFIFVLPPSLDVCRERLLKREGDASGDIERRMENARREVKEAEYYDYIIINDDLDTAFEIFKSIIIAERSRGVRSMADVERIFL
ncbi:MAG: guanylate kinase [Thermodesulfobacteriota bacterium]